MRLFVQSDFETEDLFKEFEFLTYRSEITPSSIKIDKVKKEITIPLIRMDFGRKKGFFGEKYKLSSPRLSKSELIIRDILDYEIKDNFHLNKINLLFGINIKNKEIYLCSEEEQSGITAFELTIKVNSYDLELKDKV